MMLASQHGRSGGCTDGRRGCGCGTVWTRGYRRRSSRGGPEQRADDRPVDRAGHLDRDLAAGPARYSARPPVLHKLDPYNRTTRSLTRGWRCSPAVRGGCSTRCAWRGTRAATAGAGLRAHGAAVRAGRTLVATRRPRAARDRWTTGVHAAVGTAPRAAGVARPFAPNILWLRFSPDRRWPSSDRRSGERVRALRRGVLGDTQN